MASSDRFRDFAPTSTPRDSGFGGGFLLLVVAMLAIGVGAGGAVVFFRSPAPAVVVPADLLASVTGKRTLPADKPPAPAVDPRSWSDEDLSRCGAEATAAAEAASQRKLAAVSADRVGLGAPDAKMVERVAFLRCSMRNKPLHFCNDYWRGGLIDGIKAHAVEFSGVAASAYWTRVNLADRVRQDAAANPEMRTIANDLDQTTREVRTMHEDITTALRYLVTSGIIARDDFGNFFGLGIPPDVGAMLGDARPTHNACG